jgi:FkbM family methyltransferase
MFSQWLMDSYCKKRKENILVKIFNQLLLILRKIIIRINNSKLIQYRLENVDLTLPLRHELPIIKKAFMHYDSAIGRIPKYLSQKYSSFQAIDIGANVGDTAIIIKANLDIPILCVEADDFYFNLLQFNTKNIPGIAHEHCFVGDITDNDLQLISYKGTARLIKSTKNNNRVDFKSLSEIIEKHKNFDNLKFLKIDTDGFDCKIIRANINFINQNKPVIFFEYDPYFLNQAGDDGLSVFDFLMQIDYQKLLVYDNTGSFLISTETNNRKVLEELNNYFSGRESAMYMDICAFHKIDNDIAEIIREAEFRFSKDQKNLSKHTLNSNLIGSKTFSDHLNIENKT